MLFRRPLPHFPSHMATLHVLLHLKEYLNHRKDSSEDPVRLVSLVSDLVERQTIRHSQVLRASHFTVGEQFSDWHENWAPWGG
jgi:hypothetical protein